LYLNYKNSESVTLYNAETLTSFGLTPGAKINKITYKGYKTTDEQTTSFQVYYQWTDDQTLSQPDNNTYPYATEGMTNIIDENHTWIKVGSTSELGDMIVLDFSANPLTYEQGKSLKIYMHSYVDGYKAAYFEKSTISSDFCYLRRNDAATITYSWYKSNPAVIHLSLASEPTIATGKVTPKSSDEGIVGATVTFYNAENDVKYSTKTVAGGKYSVSIIQSGLSYTATVTKEGYLDTVEDVQSFDAANNFKLLTGFILDETAENEDIISKYDNASVDKVIVNYTAKAGWNTIVLPFEITGLPYTAETKVYELVDYVGGSLQFVEHTTGNLKANTPYVFYVEEAQTEPMEFEDVAQVIDDLPDYATPTVSFIGTYSPIPAGVMTGWYGVVPRTGRIAKAGSGASIKALRAFFALETNSPAELNAIFTDAENIDTAIEGISIENGQLNINGAVDYSKPVYNLSGQRVGRDYKGVVIQNGKKIVVK
jgi:hypothetical protein